MATNEFKSQKRVVALDGDRLGPIAGAALALIVFSLSVTYQQTALSIGIIRAGWAFVLGYGATFFLVRIVLRTTLREFLEMKAARLTARRLAQQEAIRAGRVMHEVSEPDAAIAEPVAAPAVPPATVPEPEEEAGET